MNRDDGNRRDGNRDDVISDVLRALRLAGTLYFEARLASPWGFAISPGDHAVFHLVRSGTAWLSTDGGRWCEVGTGDAVVFPHGSAHRLSHEPGGGGIDGADLFDRMDDDGVVRLAGPGCRPETTIICGHFSFDRTLTHPLTHSLPDVIRSSAESNPGWTTLAELAVARSKDLSPGSRALTDRLAEVLLIELLTGLPENESRFVRSLRDPVVAAALHTLHAQPERHWTMASLSANVHTSRATLAARFAELVGESPMRYLTRWRMHLAARYLRESSLSTSQVATMIGYSSPFSFSKAFRRELGLAPSHYRQRESGDVAAPTPAS